MPHYLVQAAYTPEAVAALTKNPQNRVEAIQPTLKALKGRLEAAYMAFGEYDAVLIVELPDNVSAAAFSLGASAKGHIKAIKTTPLMTMEEGVQAMTKGGSLDIQPPG